MNRKRWIYILLFVLFILPRLFKLSTQPLWIDEGFTWAVTHLNISELIKNRIRAGHFPFYFLFMKLWVNFFGAGEFSLRFPSFMASALSLLFFISLSKKILNSERSRILAFIIFGISPYGIEIAQEARMYSPAVLIFILLVIELLKILNNETKGYKIYFLLALFFLLNGSIVFIPFVILNLYLLSNFKNQKAKNLLFLNLICLLLLLPLFYLLFKTSQFSSIERFYLQERFNFKEQLNFINYWLLEFFSQTAGLGKIAVFSFNSRILSWLLIIIPAVVFLTGVNKLNRNLRHLLLYYFWLSFIPFLFSYKIESRYLFYLFPFLALAWANWLDKIRYKKLFYTIIVLWGMSLSYDLYKYYTIPKSNWKEIAEYLNSHGDENEEIWLFPRFSAPVFSYYYQGNAKVIEIDPHNLPSSIKIDISGIWYLYWLNSSLPWVGGKHALYVDGYIKKLLFESLKFKDRKIFTSQRGNTEVLHFVN